VCDSYVVIDRIHQRATLAMLQQVAFVFESVLWPKHMFARCGF
jgi:hypothetical protein